MVETITVQAQDYCRLEIHYICNFCEKPFEKLSEFMIHLKDTHRNDIRKEHKLEPITSDGGINPWNE